MLYLKRKIDKYLEEWKKSDDKKPLIIKGARQVGKTEAINHFAKENYNNVIYINFVEQSKYKKITQDGYEVDSICKNISLLNPSLQFIPNETLLFFDEIQDFADISTSLKFFCIDKRYDVICSGSMLGINYQDVESVSVGYKIDYEMYSMDFEEFMWAKGYNGENVDEILGHISTKTPFSSTEQNVYGSMFLDYCILGGMPEIIKKYIKQNSFAGTLQMQKQLLSDYHGDVRKYVTGLDQTRIINVLNHIPVQLSKKNKKFQISKVAHGAKTKDYIGCIEWLKDAGIINVCYCLDFPELPLKGNYDASRYKLYFGDTGLLIATLDDESQNDLRDNKNLGTYKGALYENIVGEAIVKSGGSLYYYKRQDSTLEEDFFMRTRENLVPVEVKSGNNMSKSLRTLIESEKYKDITWGIKLVNGNVGYANNILTLPYYCAFLLKRYLSNI